MKETNAFSPARMSTPETACEDFMRQGYAVLGEVLEASTTSQLRDVLDCNAKGGNKKKHTIYRRVFEDHPALCLPVFNNETVLPIVQRLIGHCGSSRGRDDSC